MRMGTCSWKYPEWALVYEASTQNLLQAYSKKFDTVEIDQWFWSLFPGGVRLPEPGLARSYAESTPDDFVFTIKLPDSLSLSHFRDAGSGLKANPHFLSPELMIETLDRLKPILAKTRVLMLQFEYLNRQKMSGLADFMTRLRGFLQRLPPDRGFGRKIFLGVELRNQQWLVPDFFSLLAEHRASPVLLHGYYMKPLWESINPILPSLGRDAPVVLRLHGPERENMDRLSGKTWNRIVRPLDDDLAGLARVIRLLEDRGIETIINVNNHYEGCAPLSIGRLTNLLAQ